MEREWNVHHFYWQRRSYLNPIERQFRQHKFNKAKMNLQDHQELHCNLANPPKPTKQQLLGVLAVFDKYNDLTPLDSLELQAEYFNDKNPRITINLLKQLGYVADGLYVPGRDVV